MRRQSSRSRGQSLVEFALILPAFLLVLAGILDFGTMLYSRITLVNATREGARWAVVQANAQSIQTNASGTGVTQQGGKIGANLTGLTWADVTVTPICNQSGGGMNNCDFVPAGKPDAMKGDSILISTTYQYKSFFASFFGQTINLGTQVQMVLEVPAP